MILTLFAWKLVRSLWIAKAVALEAYPKHLHLARGNHETRNMNKLYGFEGEVTKKCGQLSPLGALFQVR